MTVAFCRLLSGGVGRRWHPTAGGCRWYGQALAVSSELVYLVVTGNGRRKGEVVQKLLDVLRSQLEGSGVNLLRYQPLSLDIERYTEYRDSYEHQMRGVFETPAPKTQTFAVKVDRMPENAPSVFSYFLDGSRRTYRIADVIFDGNRYLPLVAGQVGVAVMQRDSRAHHVRPVREFCKTLSVLACPDAMKSDIPELQRALESSGKSFKLLCYQYKKDKDPVDLGVAKIMQMMHDLEVQTVLEMASQQLLAMDRMLILDGSLRFYNDFDSTQFRNVIGVAKSFRPSKMVSGGRRDLGAITAHLGNGERTPAFRTEDHGKVIGVWYLRLRPDDAVRAPLEGVVQVERYASDSVEIEQGFDQQRVSTISAHLLEERNVTPYGADPRWANHLYPIFLAESYIKASFMTDLVFTAML